MPSRLMLTIAFGAVWSCGGTVTPIADASPEAAVCSPVVDVSGYCARKVDGTLWCWGDGPVGDGMAERHLSAVQVVALGTNVVDVAASRRIACARTNDRRLWCWGNNGAIGDGTFEDRVSPTLVAGLTDVEGVTVGFFHACALRFDGSAWCWGENSRGEVGDGTTNTRLVPTRVALSAPVTQLAAGGTHTCALTKDGMVWCWGSNVGGELGTSNLGPVNPTPVSVVALGGSNRIVVAGGNQTCAGKADGSWWCWGVGWFGNGLESTAFFGPSELATLRGAEQVVLHAGGCARAADHTLSCWGRNRYGTVGDGTTVASLSMTKVASLGASVADVSKETDTTCAVRTDGTLWCWGRNAGGEVGDGTGSGVPCPQSVDGGAADSLCRLSPVTVAGLCP